MANIKKPKQLQDKVKTQDTTGSFEKRDGVLIWIDTGLQAVNELANTFNVLNTTLDQRRSSEIDNTVKVNNVEIEAAKEQNRHAEEMAKIEQEWKKITNSAADRASRLSFIEGQITKFQQEYDKYMNMTTEQFLSTTVTSRLESLRKVIMELTKELNKAL